MKGKKVKLDPPRAEARRLPAKSTPSTGGGPFQKKKYKTSPGGLIVMIIAITITTMYVMNNTDEIEHAAQAQNKNVEVGSQSILDYAKPTGRVLLVNDLLVTVNSELTRTATNLVAQLGVAGWSVFTDSEQEARIRTWLPVDTSTTDNISKKLEDENITGILVIQQDSEDALLVSLIEQAGTTNFNIPVISTQ